MSIIKEVRRVTMYDYVREYPLNTKYIESFVQLGDELGTFYVVNYKSGFTKSFDRFSSLPKRARRIAKYSHLYRTEYYENSVIKIWEC